MADNLRFTIGAKDVPIPGIKCCDSQWNRDNNDKCTTIREDIWYTKADICKPLCLYIEAYRTKDNQEGKKAQNVMTHILTRGCEIKA